MKLHIFSVFDNKASAFLPPFYQVNEFVAMRSVANAFNDSTHDFAKNPTDYSLHRIGYFDDVTGVIESVSPPDAFGFVSSFSQPSN